MDKDERLISVCTKEKSYDIIIGKSILSEIKRQDEILKGERFTIIISANVYKLYEEYINESFAQYNNFDIIQMMDGEEYKNYKYAEEFFDKLLQSGNNRKSVIIGIGGGAVGDFAGFIAALYMRGIPVIHVPTTLLAMVDSSIGGKVAVNISAGKNIVGAFYQPEFVISDVGFVNTLPDNELKNGLTEVLKHGLIGEYELYRIMSENDLKSIRTLDKVIKLVYLSAKFKSSVVEKDEKEGGLRAILNFGHTIGHAIESLLEFKGISHGEAVAIGIKAESEISRRLGWLNDQETEKINKIIDEYGLVFNNYNLDADSIIEHMKYDKKNKSGVINFVLLKGIGNPVYNQVVKDELIRDVLKEM